MGSVLKDIVKRIMRLKLFQPVWRVMQRISAAGLRRADVCGHEPEGLAVWQQQHRSALARMGFGVGGGTSQSGERHLLTFLRDHLAKAPIIFDVGANQGDYTQLVLSVMPEANVFAFEPSPATFQTLTANVGDRKNVRLFKLGVSCAEKQAVLYSDASGSGLASVYKRRLDHFGIKMEQREEIALTTLDAFCEAHSVPQIDLLKLDTEGHELEILRGACRMLESDSIGCIQFEFGGCNIDSRTFFQDFFYCLDPQYYLYRLLPSGLIRVATYREEDEVFITTNYAALSRRRFKEYDRDIVFPPA